MKNEVRVRFAPSPTGSLHIGGIRTALYCYAMAKKNDGTFIVRMEDTDQNRFVEGAEEDVYEMLEAYGLKEDERYKQSERLSIYKKYAEKLIEKGDAYYCFSTKEEIDSARKIAQENKEVFKFRSPHRDLSVEEAQKRIEEGEKYVIRQKVPMDTEVEFEDGLQGKMKFNTNDIDDTVLLKSDGFPTYHLAVVVDDHLMEISHVFRGVEWIPSIPKHVLLYKSFGWDLPEFYHLTVILDPSGGKLSKRKGTVAAREFLKEGYLPAAVLNFLMFLGWSPPLKREHGKKERELFTLEEFIEMFDLKDLNKSSPVFNREKLIWFNKQYLQIISDDELNLKFTGWMLEYGLDKELEAAIIKRGPDFLNNILGLIKDRISIFSEIPESIELFYKDIKKVDLGEMKKLKKADPENLQKALKDYYDLTAQDDGKFIKLDHEAWEKEVRALADKHDLKHGHLFMAVRAAVTGSMISPPLFETIQILGVEETVNRLKKHVK